MVWKIVFGTVLGLGVALVAVTLIGQWVWHTKSEQLLTELAASAHETRTADFAPSQLEGLRAPVQECLSQVLSAGQKPVSP